MTGTTGKRYLCVIPESSDAMADFHDLFPAARTPSGKKDPEKTSEKQISDFRKALEPVGEKESSCFTKTYGYWSYEYCPRRSVRQFHREGKKETVSILLGTYTPSGDRVLVGDTSSPQTSADPPSATSVASTTSNDAKEAPLFEEHYEGGDGSRVAIVQFSCDKNTQGTDRIAEIVENPTHTYTIRFATRAVCPLGQIEDSATSAERLLAPLRTQCLRKVDSWWTYEVCPGKRVQQYHKEKNAPRPTIIHLLGRYNASESLGIEHLESIPNETNRVVQYFVEAYTNGSSCDITKNPRRVNVKYKCAIDEKFSFIESVVEQSTCAYAIVVATPLLCAHPAFEASKREEADGALTVHCIGEGSEMAL